jgi:F420-dependent oxidoreductase-like protein
VTIRLGYQIPNFTYPGTGVEDLFGLVTAQAQEAEAAGFDTVLLMDHFYQLPGLGTPEQPMLECYTALGALASATSKVQLSALVTGNTYRHPAVLAKTVTTLDVVSGGRAVLGIGAGWYELEHENFGIEFGTFTDRFEKLEEALQIIGPMFRGENPTFSGTRYQVENAMNNPRVRPNIPIMLGGSGEKKTFRMAAQYADHMNIICGRPDIPRKVAALRQRCEELGRDPESLPTSHLTSVAVAQDAKDAERLNEQIPEAWRPNVIVGTPEQIAEAIKGEILDAGIDGITVNMPYDGHVPGNLTAVGAALSPLVA